jgi:pyruvate formate lyase activating enzyme
LVKPQIFLNKDRCAGCGKCILVCPRQAIEIKGGKSCTNRELCDGCGKCVEACPNEARTLMGRWVSAEEVVDVVKKDSVFYEKSGGGVTLSGGDPIAQPEFAVAILKLCKNNHIHTAIETCGHAPWKTLKQILEYTDLVMYDFKHMDPEKHREYTGASNALILDNARRIAHELPTTMWARIPIIPGYNDSLENIEATAKFIVYELGSRVEQVNLLPYHKLGETKYERLEKNYPIHVEPPSEDHLLGIKKVFESYGLATYVGG